MARQPPPLPLSSATPGRVLRDPPISRVMSDSGLPAGLKSRGKTWAVRRRQDMAWPRGINDAGGTGGVRPRCALVDPAKGLFDASTLRGAIVARGWTVREFSTAAGVSHESVYRALRQVAVSDRTVVRVVAALETRTPSRLIDG